MCSYPGCVSYAVSGEEACIVHRHPAGGKTCVACAGSGWLVTEHARMPCPRCGAVGLRDKPRRVPKVKKRDRDTVDERGLVRLAAAPQRPGE